MNSIKEYYTNLQKMFSDAVTMLSAINQSLTSNTQEVSFQLLTSNDVIENVRIPSYLWLESRIEELSNNFNSLVNIEKDGNAWLVNNNSTYKLSLVQSNVAPNAPTINLANNDVTAYYKENIRLKDFVTPHMYARFNVNNINSHADTLVVKKLIIHDPDLFEQLYSNNFLTYEDYLKALETKSVNDYSSYDIEVPLKTKRSKYKSLFRIEDLPLSSISHNPYLAENTNKYRYVVTFNTIQYTDAEDPSQKHLLKVGDYLSLVNNYALYEIISIEESSDDDGYNITIEERVGHIFLQRYSENNNMAFVLYEKIESNNEIVEIPLEENPYIVLFISSKIDNIRSAWSNALIINLNEIYMVDNEGHNIIDDQTQKKMSYMDYYNKYCVNIGDKIEGICSILYNQINQYTPRELNELQNNDDIQILVDESVDMNNINVIQINSHLYDDVTKKDIESTVANKEQKKQELNDLKNSLTLAKKEYYETDYSNTPEEKESMEKNIAELKNQIKDIQTEINTLTKSLSTWDFLLENSDNRNKFRVSGVLNTKAIEKYISENYNKVDIIGIDVEYKYVNTLYDNVEDTSLINDTVVTKWNKMSSIDKEREIYIENNSVNVKYVNYENNINIIKWNELDIPIRNNEKVLFRVRYKYSIGQPFINIYSCWSNTMEIPFPENLSSVESLLEKIHDNIQDANDASFINILNEEGYTEHISNYLENNGKKFHHTAEDIYSGYMDDNGVYLSLKEKITQLENKLQAYEEELGIVAKENYTVNMVINGNHYELTPNNYYEITEELPTIAENYYNIYLEIKNTGSSNIKLYSIFNGLQNNPISDDTTLLSVIYNESFIDLYAKCPLYDCTNDGSTTKDHEDYEQKYNQFIYFRQDADAAKSTNKIRPVINTTHPYNKLLCNEDSNGFHYYTLVANDTLLIPVAINLTNTRTSITDQLYFSLRTSTNMEGIKHYGCKLNLAWKDDNRSDEEVKSPYTITLTIKNGKFDSNNKQTFYGEYSEGDTPKWYITADDGYVIPYVADYVSITRIGSLRKQGIVKLKKGISSNMTIKLECINEDDIDTTTTTTTPAPTSSEDTTSTTPEPISSDTTPQLPTN